MEEGEGGAQAEEGGEGVQVKVGEGGEQPQAGEEGVQVKEGGDVVGLGGGVLVLVVGFHLPQEERTVLHLQLTKTTMIFLRSLCF